MPLREIVKREIYVALFLFIFMTITAVRVLMTMQVKSWASWSLLLLLGFASAVCVGWNGHRIHELLNRNNRRQGN